MNPKTEIATVVGLGTVASALAFVAYKVLRKPIVVSAAPPIAPPIKAPPVKSPPVNAPPVKAPPVKAPPVKVPTQADTPVPVQIIPPAIDEGGVGGPDTFTPDNTGPVDPASWVLDQLGLGQ